MELFKLKDVLFYSDGILAFSAIYKDEITFVFSWYGELENENLSYLGFPIGSGLYTELIGGQIDLKSAINQSLFGLYFEVCFENKAIKVIGTKTELGEDDLPEKGLFLKLENTEEVQRMVKERKALQKR